jgi:predicted hydrolase (HD superfamily)
MIPNDQEIYDLWEKYQLPTEKQTHVVLVETVALFLADKVQAKIHETINLGLLHAAALLHDIDKHTEKLPGERHPDACVRILNKADMKEVANVVATHPLHAILDPTISPKTWEQKLLFLADKMVKYEILTVDKRFNLWRDEMLSPEDRTILEKCYPKVKQLEKEILTFIDVSSEVIAKLL